MEYGSKVINTDSYLQEENISYLIDYEENSTTALGSKSKGSLYIRGVKATDGGYDTFKFILEKGTDLS